MTVYKKLQQARVKLHNTKLNKSGENKFAKFHYFELGDFIPQVTAIFNELGLCGTVSFTQTEAYLTVYNVDGDKDDFVTFTSPMVYANMEKMQAIQNLGSTHTYMRRYLWLMAMEIVENDAVDAAEPATPTLAPPFKPAKAEPIPKPKAKVATNMNDDGWTISSENVMENLPAVVLAVETLLAVAKNEEDLLTIFQKNKKVFDEIKAGSESEFEALMAKFTATKEQLKG